MGCSARKKTDFSQSSLENTQKLYNVVTRARLLCFKLSRSGKFFKPKRVENALSIVFLCSLLAAPAARGFAPALNCIEAQCSGAALAGFNVGNVDTVMREGTL